MDRTLKEQHTFFVNRDCLQESGAYFPLLKFEDSGLVALFKRDLQVMVKKKKNAILGFGRKEKTQKESIHAIEIEAEMI
jgi:hypothetical protein